MNAINELEDLKPAVQRKIDELNRKHTYQLNGLGHIHQNNTLDASLEWPSVQKQNSSIYAATKVSFINFLFLIKNEQIIYILIIFQATSFVYFIFLISCGISSIHN